jgi:phenylalanine-4-hydroxylase
MENNEVIAKLPRHLLQFVVDQPYKDYTPIDQAVWRYVMRQNYSYLSKVSHGSYLEGLKKTGISIDKIPNMYGMNRILKEIGWAAVAVDGFIPPAAFMEFQAYKVLVIAADIRTQDHIEYTPAPDIIHEAAGHAPIIADPEYAEYLRFFGEIGCKAFSSKKDYELYEAIRHLSIIKETKGTKIQDILEAEQRIESIQSNMGEPSEMSKIRNLHWWSVEYGLIGDLENFKIYGAGLLSSIGESSTCMMPEVKKLPYTIQTADFAFDITTKQPQLFVTPSFQYLNDVLDEFANTMALRKGGAFGIKKAIDSQSLATYTYSSGLQVTGIVTDKILGNDGEPIYINTVGKTALSYKGKELIGHSSDYHKEGFSSPVGLLKNSKKPIERMTLGDLKSLGIVSGQNVNLEFESGITVQGYLSIIRRSVKGKILLMLFKDCTVSYAGKILFRPEWGDYDMAIGEKIVSVFAGASDPDAYEVIFKVPDEKTTKYKYSESDLKQHALFNRVKQIRESSSDLDNIYSIWDEVKVLPEKNWLLLLEILEVISVNKYDEKLENEIRQQLETVKLENKDLKKLIDDGLNQINSHIPSLVI